jgi:hypothetical protein
MTRTPTIPKKIQQVLEEAGSKGLDRLEFDEKLGSKYAYTELLRLIHHNDACKIGDRFYWGSPEQWLSEVGTDGWIHLNSTTIQIFRKAEFTLAQERRDLVDKALLESKAIEGLEYYFLWCRLNNKPWPIDRNEITATKEEAEGIRSRVNDVIQSVSVQPTPVVGDSPETRGFWWLHEVYKPEEHMDELHPESREYKAYLNKFGMPPVGEVYDSDKNIKQAVFEK